MTVSSPLLRAVLRIDAIACAAAGGGLTLFAGALSPLLGLPSLLLFEVGLGALVCAAVVGWMSTRAGLPVRTIWAAIGLDLGWVALSIAALALGWITPTALGLAVVIGQAVAVGAIGELQYLAIRRAPRVAGA